MPRERNPERELSKQRYIESDGKMTSTELAEIAGVKSSQIRKWKAEDKWDEALKNKPRKRGGQKGNKNAAGKTPAKNGNKNAVTHGAFARVGYGDLSVEKQEEVKAVIEARSLDKMMDELESLYVRKAYLEQLLTKYESERDSDTFYTDKVVHMIVPKSIEEQMEERDSGMDCGTAKDPEDSTGRGKAKYKTAMKSIIKASPFDRAMKVEAELNKLHGRIIKQLDSIKGYELEVRRLELEERRYKLMKQKITGEYDVDPEEDELMDDECELIE